MYDFFELLASFYSNIISLFESYTFDIGGLSVNLFQLIIGFVLMSFVVSIFWKGARG